MITVIASAGTSLKLVKMSSSDPENSTLSKKNDDLVARMQKFLDALPDNAATRAAIAEGRDIANIVESLELPANLNAAAAIYPLFRENVLDVTLLENSDLGDLSQIILGLVQLGQFSLPEDWQPGEALAIKQSEALRKMLLAIVSDVRLVLVRIAEQLYRLRQAKNSSRDTQKKLAVETPGN